MGVFAYTVLPNVLFSFVDLTSYIARCTLHVLGAAWFRQGIGTLDACRVTEARKTVKHINDNTQEDWRNMHVLYQYEPALVAA